VTGQPLSFAFVGSEFGGSATTTFEGFYRFTNVPLGTGDTPREWRTAS